MKRVTWALTPNYHDNSEQLSANALAVRGIKALLICLVGNQKRHHTNNVVIIQVAVINFSWCKLATYKWGCGSALHGPFLGLHTP